MMSDPVALSIIKHTVVQTLYAGMNHVLQVSGEAVETL